jgi:long-chain fatty acid transport protein
VISAAPPARATGVTEVPDNGSEQMARGGAWLARASDPLATLYNPAGLAGQPSRVTIQANVFVHQTCFERVKATNDTTQDPMASLTGHYPRVCNDIVPRLNPQFGATWRATDRLGIGVLVVGPASVGEKDWPEFVNDASGPQAPPNRYLAVKQAGIALFPTVGVGYEVIDDLRLGASFSWGFAKLRFANAALGLNSDATTAANDVRANLQVADYFIPGFTLGALFSATPEIDLGAWYKWSDAIRATGDVGTAANYYTKENAAGNDKNVRYGDTIFEDCGTGLAHDAQAKPCGSGDNAKLKIVIPMELKVGARYHKPRTVAVEDEIRELRRATPHRRDPVHDDVFDIEVNLTWANDSAAATTEVRFPDDGNGNGKLPVAGVPGGSLPPNADQTRGYHDVWGVRVGGDYVVVPDRVALRAGTFFETQASTSQYQSIDFDAAARVGLSLGGTYRVALGTGALDVMLGYGHVFYFTQQRDDPNADGIQALAGTPCNNATPVNGRCPDGSPTYRTKWPVNLGTITNATNILNLGLSYRF